MVKAGIEEILKELRSGLEKIYSSRLKGIYLFGSYARGEEREGSDIDLAVVLDDFAHPGEEIERTAELVASLCLKHDCLVTLVPIRAKDWEKRKSPLLLNIKREGVAV